MLLNIHSQNLRGAFSYEKYADEMMVSISRELPDVAIYPEAYDEGREHLLKGVIKSLDYLGYVTGHTLYKDDDGRKDRRGMMTIVKKELLKDVPEPEVVRFGGRNMMRAWASDRTDAEPVNIYGIHLNDRIESGRIEQGAALTSSMPNGNQATVVAGDFNSVYRTSPRGLKFHFATVISGLVDLKLMPATDPESVNPRKSLGRIGSKGKRLHEISKGEAIQVFVAAGFIDADRSFRPTAPAAKPIAQLDHIMVNQKLDVLSFNVNRGIKSTDHLAISARVVSK